MPFTPSLRTAAQGGEAELVNLCCLAGLLNRTRKGTPCLSITDVPSLDAALASLRG